MYMSLWFIVDLSEPDIFFITLHLLLKVNSAYKRATIDLLLDGLNKAVAVVGKVLFFIKHDNVAPL